MRLNHQRYGESGPAVLILHGLFGNLSNWGSISKQLGENYAVIGVDLRNHGASPHNDELDYPVMAADVLELMDALGLDSCKLVGHSMGGKVAMEIALAHPQRVERLAV
ncbi:MAG: alpha/beta fold hydrolase, partial [Gammaproteobacteria bacterium]